MQIFSVYIFSLESILSLKLDPQLILLRLLSGQISSASCEDMCLFTQDYAELSLFINKTRETQKAFLNKKFIQMGLFTCLRSKAYKYPSQRDLQVISSEF